MEEQLQKLKNIEVSLHSLRNKLKLLCKQENKNQIRMSDVFLKAIPIVQNKMKQTDAYQKIQARKIANKTLEKLQQQRVKQHRLVQLQDISQSRQASASIKANQSKQLRQMSLNNQQRIIESRSLMLQCNKQKKNSVKIQLQSGKQNINLFRKHKQMKVRKVRQEEQEAGLGTLKKKRQEYKKLASIEKQASLKMNETSCALRKLREAAGKIQQMESGEIKKIGKKIMGSQQRIAQHILNKIMDDLGNRQRQQ